MKVDVTREKVTITENTCVNENDFNVNKCEFTLPSEFNGLIVTASFNGIPIVLNDDFCYIPNLNEGTATLGVYAYKENADGLQLMYSPSPTFFDVGKGSYSKIAVCADVPEISEFESYCRSLSEYVEEQLKLMNEKNNDFMSQINELCKDEVVLWEEEVDFRYREEIGESIAICNKLFSKLPQGEMYIQYDDEVYKALIINYVDSGITEIVCKYKNDSFTITNINSDFVLYKENQEGEHFVKLFKKSKQTNIQIYIPSSDGRQYVNSSIISYKLLAPGEAEINVTVNGTVKETCTVILGQLGEFVYCEGDFFENLSENIEKGDEIQIEISQSNREGDLKKYVATDDFKVCNSIIGDCKLYYKKDFSEKEEEI